jgi:hypothetical protein
MQHSLILCFGRTALKGLGLCSRGGFRSMFILWFFYFDSWRPFCFWWSCEVKYWGVFQQEKFSENLKTKRGFRLSNVSANDGCPKDVELRINKASAVFSRLKNTWRVNYIHYKLKIKIFNSCAQSVLLYGCETWFVTNDIMSKLQAFVNRCIRYIMKIWWPRRAVATYKPS